MTSANTNLFSAPKLPKPNRSALMQMLNFLNVQSGDTSQLVREFYRQVTVVPPDRSVDYMWRGVSGIPSAFIREVSYRALRLFYSVPLFEAALDMDRLDKQPYLKAFGIENPQAYVNISDYSTLRDRLTDDMYGSDYKALPRLLREKDKHWANEFDETLGKRAWKQVWVEANDPLVKHLDYWMDFRQMLTNLKELPGKLDYKLPYFEDANPTQVAKVVDTVKDSLDHLQKHTGLGSYLYRANNLFRDMAHGRYALDGRVDTNSALFVLDKELGGLGLKPTFNRPETQLLKLLTSAIGASKTPVPLTGLQPFMKGVQEYFSLYKAPHQVAQKVLEKKYLTGGLDSPEKVKLLLNDLLSGTVEHKGKALSFQFDNARFGLQAGNIERFANALSEEVGGLNQFLRQASTQLQSINTPSEMQHLGKQLHHHFNERLLSLASVFPGKSGRYTGKRGSELMQEALKAGSHSPIGQLLTDGIRAEGVMPKTLQQIAKTSFWPQIAVSCIVTAFGFGTLRAWLDQEVAQPYQKKIVAKKGDVVGTVLPFGLGMVAGLTTFAKLMSSPTMRGILKNNYIAMPVVASIAALTVEAAVTVGTLVPLMNAKKDLPETEQKPVGETPKVASVAVAKKPEAPAVPFVMPLSPVTLPQKPSPWPQEKSQGDSFTAASLPRLSQKPLPPAFVPFPVQPQGRFNRSQPLAPQALTSFSTLAKV
jgi:hypothetical protein